MTPGLRPFYIPRKDVKMDRLVRTSHRTYCPFKGGASYYSLRDGPENAVWSYEEPYDEMAAMEDLVAFHPDEVDSIAVVPDGRARSGALTALPSDRNLARWCR